MPRAYTSRKSRRSDDGLPPGRGEHDPSARAEGPIDRLQDDAGNHAVADLLEHGAHDLPAVRRGLSTPGTPLDARTRVDMEARQGHDLRDVRLHRGEEAARSAEALNAEAYTAGSDVVLGSGAPHPGSEQGSRLLAHELAHVVQQRGTAQSGRPPGSFEAQADAAATKGAAVAGLGPAGATGVQRKAKPEKERDEPKPGPAPEGGEKAEGSASAKDEKKKEPGKSLLGSIWSGIKGAASTVWSGMKTAGEAVWGGMKKAANWAWEGLKTVGGWIAAGAEKVWAAASWLGRQLWDKVTGIFLRVTRWVARLPERVGRLFAGLWEGLISLKPWSLEWWKSLGKAETWTGFLKWLGARAVDLAEILGIGEIYETVMDLLKFNTRSMTSAEIADASSIFGSSIQFALVRIDERAVLGPAFSDREYTSFHTINGWGAIDPDVLIHELTHVWQYETAGGIYMPQAIHAQVWGEGYVYKGAAGLQAAKAAGKGMAGFNREQQAQIVQDFYRLKKGMPTADPNNPATVADLALYADFVKDVSTLGTAQLLA